MIFIILDDTGIAYEKVYDRYMAADAWAQEHCKSYEGYEITDISDMSLTNDVVAEYVFADERDGTLFKLKWS
jgi:hypothetical protein